MKKIIKKLGLLSIIIAVIIPFTRLPEVKATTGCSNHTIQQYLFLDRINGNEWSQYQNGGYTTSTSFIDLFPTVGSDKTIKILGVDTIYEFQNASTSTGIASFSSFHGAVQTLNTNSYSGYDYENNISKIGNYDVQDLSTYTLNTILHGFWARETDNTLSKATWDIPGNQDNFRNHTIQGVILNSSTASYDNKGFGLVVSGATYNANYGTQYNIAQGYSNIADYFTAVANRTNSKLISSKNSNDYLSLQINRTISKAFLNTLKFGHSCSGSTKPCGESFTTGYAVYSSSAENHTGSITESYDGLISDKWVHQDTDQNIDILTNETYYWPAILEVEYEVCPTSTTGNWSVEYNLNVTDDSASNKPDVQTEAIGTNIAVSSSEPSRKDYKFLKWCTEPNGSGTCYSPGETVYYKDGVPLVTLYAQWGTTETGNNNKTGIVSYVIGFISVGIIAGAIYLVSKRKNLFKQI